MHAVSLPVAASWDWVCCCYKSQWLLLTFCWTRCLLSCAFLDERSVGTGFTMCCFFVERPFPLFSICLLLMLFIICYKKALLLPYFFLSRVFYSVSLIVIFFTLTFLDFVRPCFLSEFPWGNLLFFVLLKNHLQTLFPSHVFLFSIFFSSLAVDTVHPTLCPF